MKKLILLSITILSLSACNKYRAWKFDGDYDCTVVTEYWLTFSGGYGVSTSTEELRVVQNGDHINVKGRRIPVSSFTKHDGKFEYKTSYYYLSFTKKEIELHYREQHASHSKKHVYKGSR